MYNIKIDNIMSVVSFLQSKGVFRLLNNDKNYSLIRVQNNVARLIGDFQIIDIIKEELKSQNRLEDLHKFVKTLNKTKLIESLDYFNKSFLRDEKNKSYFFFNNTGIIVNQDDLYPTNLEDIDLPIWESQIVNRNFIPNSFESDFSQFIKDISGTVEKKESLESIIGYLLTDYKDPTTCPGIILTDKDNINNQANGGTGKSLFMKAIGHMVNINKQDGKRISRRFQFSGIDETSKIVYIDDVTPEFEYEEYYSLITGDLNVERKYENTFNIGFETSPKLAISSNYVIKSDGGTSDKRRRIEFELENYYSPEFTPEDKFGSRLFLDWSDEQWCSFYLYMMNCVRFYLKNGLIVPEVNKDKQIIAQTSDTFMNFCNEKIVQGRIDKSILHKSFSQLDSSISQKQFKTWLDIYCTHKMLDFEHKSSNGKSLLIIR